MLGKKSAAPAEKSGLKPLVIILSFIVAALLVAVGFLLYTYFYHHSEGYLTHQAEKAILAGDYDEGLKTISSFSSDRAEAVRAYVQLLKHKDYFAAAFRPQELQTSQSDAYSYYNTLLTVFHDFSGADWLPSGLKEQYDGYQERLEAMDAVLGVVTEADLCDAQICVFDFKKRKEGASFTIEELNTTTLVSEPVVMKMDHRLIHGKAYQNFSAVSQAKVITVMNAFYTTTANQVHQNRFDLQTYRSRQLEGKDIKLNDQVERYEANIAEGLRPLNSEADITANAATLYEALRFAWTAYAFDIHK